MTQEQLSEILENHEEWLKDSSKGERANLIYADLSGADLRYANLRYANLIGANLIYADLRYADLRYANLRYADLSGANLIGANLRYADLREVDLDFSVLFMSCKSLYANFDIKHYNQFMYHILKSIENNDLIDYKTKKQFLTKNNIKIANKFHRVEECGKVGETK